MRAAFYSPVMSVSIPTLDEIRQAVREEVMRALADSRPASAPVSLPEASRRLGVSVKTLRRMVDSGEILSVRVRRRVLIDLDQFKQNPVFHGVSQI